MPTRGRNYRHSGMAYLFLAVLGLPPDFIAGKRLHLLALFPWALGYDVALHKALKVAPRPVLAAGALIRVRAKAVVVVRVFPRFSLQVAHDAVVRCQHRGVLRGVIEAAGDCLDVTRQAAEDSDVLRLADDIGYDDAGRRLAFRVGHDVVSER